jgi:hypothetical protein
MTQESLERLSSLANTTSQSKRLKFSQSLSKSIPSQFCDQNAHESETESDSESHQLTVSLLGFQHKLLGPDVAQIVQLASKLSTFPSTFSLKGSERSEDFQSMPKCRLTKCSFFQTSEAFSVVPYKVCSPVPVAIFRLVVSKLKHTIAKITEAKFTAIFQLWKESGLKEFGGKLWNSSAQWDSKKWRI